VERSALRLYIFSLPWHFKPHRSWWQDFIQIFLCMCQFRPSAPDLCIVQAEVVDKYINAGFQPVIVDVDDKMLVVKDQRPNVVVVFFAMLSLPCFFKIDLGITRQGKRTGPSDFVIPFWWTLLFLPKFSWANQCCNSAGEIFSSFVSCADAWK